MVLFVKFEPGACAVLQSLANNYGAFVKTVPAVLNVVDFAHRLVGPKPLEYISGAMNRMSNHLVPTWNPYMPRVRLCHLYSTPCFPSISLCRHNVRTFQAIFLCCMYQSGLNAMYEQELAMPSAVPSLKDFM